MGNLSLTSEQSIIVVTRGVEMIWKYYKNFVKFHWFYPKIVRTLLGGWGGTPLTSTPMVVTSFLTFSLPIYYVNENRQDG